MTQLRALRSEDLEGVARFFDGLSDESLYHRFFSRGHGGPLYELAYLRALDPQQAAALVAEEDGRIIGLARYHRTAAGHAEVAVVVADECQHHGVGRRLLRELTAVARRNGIETLDVSMLGDNLAALGLLRRLAGPRPLQLDHGVFEATIPLAG